MQHTDKYKFNLIETSDTFSPDALNENARTTEAELAALAQATAAADAALAQTDADNKAELLTAIGIGGKTARIAFGSYVGTGHTGIDNNRSRLTFDFKPHLFAIATTLGELRIYIRPVTKYYVEMEWGENEITWFTTSESSQMCMKDRVYYYLAIGEALE